MTCSTINPLFPVPCRGDLNRGTPQDSTIFQTATNCPKIRRKVTKTIKKKINRVSAKYNPGPSAIQYERITAQ
jgi:hypothetical protein